MIAALLFVLPAIAISMLIVAVVLVSVASKLEDSMRTLGQPPPGPTTAVARRILGFRARGIEWHARDVEWTWPEAHSRDEIREHLAGSAVMPVSRILLLVERPIA